MSINITVSQLEAIKRKLQNLISRVNVTEVNTMYNPLMENIIIVRSKQYVVTDDGGTGVDIIYECVDAAGNISPCVEKFGGDIYNLLRDFVIFDFSNPLIKIVT
jgi:maltodextrin utilization protein YvdJ